MLSVGSLFSGVGGLDIAVEAFFNAEIVWHCEFAPEPSKVLAARWPGVPNLGDITRVDWSQVEPVDILCGGFPCQDLSLAGRRSGMRPGTRSGLWSDFARAIRELRPKVVVIENVRGLLSGCAESDSDLEPCPGCVGDGEHRPLVRALGRVLGDLADLGFDAEWGGLLASDVGAPHGRFRVFVVAYARGVRFESWRVAGSGEAAGGWSSAVVGGRGGASVTLLPTPAAMNPNEEEDIGAWLARRERVKAAKKNGNGFGVPPGVAVRLLPTPQAHDAIAGKTPEQVAAMRRRTGAGVSNLNEVVPALLPTPQVADAMGGHASRSGSRSDELLLPGVAAQAADALAWGPYASAVRRWEALTRPAPPPTRPDGRDGKHRLNPELPEWMMGYPAGWVTDVIGRNAAIKACGNGVVPQQAYAALEQLWERVLEAV